MARSIPQNLDTWVDSLWQSVNHFHDSRILGELFGDSRESGLTQPQCIFPLYRLHETRPDGQIVEFTQHPFELLSIHRPLNWTHCRRYGCQMTIAKLSAFGPSGLQDYGCDTLHCKIWSLPFLWLRSPLRSSSWRKSKERKGSGNPASRLCIHLPCWASSGCTCRSRASWGSSARWTCADAAAEKERGWTKL